MLHSTDSQLYWAHVKCVGHNGCYGGRVDGWVCAFTASPRSHAGCGVKRVCEALAWGHGSWLAGLALLSFDHSRYCIWRRMHMWCDSSMWRCNVSMCEGQQWQVKDYVRDTWLLCPITWDIQYECIWVEGFLCLGMTPQYRLLKNEHCGSFQTTYLYY